MTLTTVIYVVVSEFRIYTSKGLTFIILCEICSLYPNDLVNLFDIGSARALQSGQIRQYRSRSADVGCFVYSSIFRFFCSLPPKQRAHQTFRCVFCFTDWVNFPTKFRARQLIDLAVFLALFWRLFTIRRTDQLRFFPRQKFEAHWRKNTPLSRSSALGTKPRLAFWFYAADVISRWTANGGVIYRWTETAAFERANDAQLPSKLGTI